MRPFVVGLGQYSLAFACGTLPPLDVNGVYPPLPRFRPWSEKRAMTRGAASKRVAVSPAEAESDRAANAAMERYSRGDDRAFGEVYDRIAPRLRPFLLRRTHNQATADDLLQQTMLQIHRHRGTYLPGAAVLPWAFAIARRLCIDEFRHGRRDALFVAEGATEAEAFTTSGPDDEVIGQETAAIVAKELSRIPETQRSAFELVRLEGLSHEQAASTLGTSVSAVKLRAFRAYAAIRAALSGRSSKSARENQVNP